jgi:hypothetical protein
MPHITSTEYFPRTSNVQQQEAAHDTEIFVKAIHAVDGGI